MLAPPADPGILKLAERAPFSRESVLGSLIMFCGGAMSHVLNERKAGEMRSAFANATLHKPFMAMHPFGEQARPTLLVLTDRKQLVQYGTRPCPFLC